MCIIHEWGKWKQYEVKIPARPLTQNFELCAMVELRQRKRCSKCEKVIDVLIKQSIGVTNDIGLFANGIDPITRVVRQSVDRPV